MFFQKFSNNKISQHHSVAIANAHSPLIVFLELPLLKSRMISFPYPSGSRKQFVANLCNHFLYWCTLITFHPSKLNKPNFSNFLQGSCFSNCYLSCRHSSNVCIQLCFTWLGSSFTLMRFYGRITWFFGQCSPPADIPWNLHIHLFFLV